MLLVDTVFHHVGQAGLELLTLSDSPTSASQSGGMTGVSHHTQAGIFISDRFPGDAEATSQTDSSSESDKNPLKSLSTTPTA